MAPLLSELLVQLSDLPGWGFRWRDHRLIAQTWLMCRVYVHSWKLIWKPKRGPIKTTVPLKWAYRGFHVSLGECKV